MTQRRHGTTEIIMQSKLIDNNVLSASTHDLDKKDDVCVKTSVCLLHFSINKIITFTEKRNHARSAQAAITQQHKRASR
jgi:hypothetical protein